MAALLPALALLLLSALVAPPWPAVADHGGGTYTRVDPRAAPAGRASIAIGGNPTPVAAPNSTPAAAPNRWARAPPFPRAGRASPGGRDGPRDGGFPRIGFGSPAPAPSGNVPPRQSPARITYDFGQGLLDPPAAPDGGRGGREGLGVDPPRLGEGEGGGGGGGGAGITLGQVLRAGAGLATSPAGQGPEVGLVQQALVATAGAAAVIGGPGREPRLYALGEGDADSEVAADFGAASAMRVEGGGAAPAQWLPNVIEWVLRQPRFDSDGPRPFAVPDGFSGHEDFCQRYLSAVTDDEASLAYQLSYPLTGSVPQGYTAGCIVGDNLYSARARSLSWDGKRFRRGGELSNLVQLGEGLYIDTLPGTYLPSGQSWYNRREQSIIIEYPANEQWDPFAALISGVPGSSFYAYRDEIREVHGQPGLYVGKMFLRPFRRPNITPYQLMTIHFVLMQL